MARWNLKDKDDKEWLLPTEFNHYEGALARTLHLPTLVLVQEDVKRRVVSDFNFAGFVGLFRKDSNVDWLHTEEFRVPFKYWIDTLKERRDVFLGYCSASKITAQAVKTHLLALGATVLDWQTDFIPGRSILDQIEQAAVRSVAGVFLFTKDDNLSDAQGKAGVSVPRDNVVFEAGYFVGLKGKHNVLIIRESESKMPADLGGDIYAPLKDRSDITPIKPTLEAFIKAI